MDHLAMFTKFHDRAATIILRPLLLFLYKCTITMCYAMRIYISTLDAVCMTTTD